ncbi:MAG: DUF2157 domain-containing protein, partial [Pacificimonas sp.]
MKLGEKLAAWEQAGLIDGATAARIAAHEAVAGKPKLRSAIIGLGALAMALGILLIIAANWDAIPDALKLGVHLILTALAGAVVWWAARQPDPKYIEGALVIFAALVLGGYALH